MPVSSQITQFLPFETLEVFFVDELIDRLLDVGDLGREARFDLRNRFLHELDVLHFLAGFHDADDGRLGTVSGLVSLDEEASIEKKN